VTQFLEGQHVHNLIASAVQPAEQATYHCLSWASSGIKILRKNDNPNLSFNENCEESVS